MEVLYPSNLALLSMFLKHPHTNVAADVALDLKKEDPVDRKTGKGLEGAPSRGLDF